jgi:hypothetical protein
MEFPDHVRVSGLAPDGSDISEQQTFIPYGQSTALGEPTTYMDAEVGQYRESSLPPEFGPSGFPSGYWPQPFFGGAPPMGTFYNRPGWQSVGYDFTPPMGIPTYSLPNQPPPIRSHPASPPGLFRNDPTPTKPGSVVILDQFISPGGHGEMVNLAVAGMPTAGQVASKQIGIERLDAEAVQWATKPHPEATPEQARAALHRGIVAKSRWILESQANQLNKLRDEGLHHSAVNISQGDGPASEIKRMMEPFGQPNDPKSRVAIANYCRAFNGNQALMYDENPTISGPERLKMKQSIIAFCMDAFKDPEIGSSKQRYDRAVEDLSKEKVSVVVSAGNEADLQTYLNRTTFHEAIKLPPGCFDNLFSNQHTVTVGSTLENGSKTCEFSSPEPRMTIMADGELVTSGDSSQWGSSISAPRVAVALANVHAKYPNLTNEQALEKLKREACDAVPGQTSPNLNTDKLKVMIDGIPTTRISVEPVAAHQAQSNEALIGANEAYMNQPGLGWAIPSLAFVQPLPAGYNLPYGQTGPAWP